MAIGQADAAVTENKARVALKARSKEVEGIRKRTIRLLTGVVLAGLLGTIFYAAQFTASQFWEILAISLLLAAASAVSGGILGFLFGIPRGRRPGEVESPVPSTQPPSASQPAPPTQETGGQREVAIRPNTNLEDISDWLTKILVGVGLTQLGSVVAGMTRLGNALAPALGDASSSAAFGLTLAITFAGVGFLVGYLWTRFYLGTAFQRAEVETQNETILEALAEVRQRQDDVRRTFYTIADSPAFASAGVEAPDLEPLLAGIVTPPKPTEQLLQGYANEYQQVRNSMPRGSPQRTLQLSKIVTEAFILAKEREMPPGEISKMFHSSEGGRIAALAWVRANPRPEFLDLVLLGIEHSLSAFEQYQALRAAEVMTPQLDQEQRGRLRAALEDQMSGGPEKYITQESDRWPVAERILGLL